MPDYYHTNLSLDDIRGLLHKDELEEEPVPLDVFVQDKYYLGLPPLSPIQTTIVEHMTQIYKLPTLERLYGEERAQEIWTNTVNEVICEIGKGGGKDFSIRIAFARIIYFLHCLKDPLGYYGLGGGEYIDLLNIALNAEQAQRVFFEPLKNILSASPYFQKQEFNPMSKQITFMSKPVRAFSGHSEAEGWEGFNLIAAVLDEIAAFKAQQDNKPRNEATKGSAKIVYDMARLSVISRFPDIGKVALLSFPRYEGDFISKRYDDVIEEKVTKKIKKDLGPIEIEWFEDDIKSYREPKVWAVKCPTFVSNPTRSPEDFTSDFIRDPVESRSRILCVPPKMAEAYFRDVAAVYACFHRHDTGDCQEESCPRPPEDDYGRLPQHFTDREGPDRFIHIDLGLNRDRSALAMVHCRGFAESPLDGEKRPIIRHDLIRYWEAPPDGEIDFNDIRKLVFTLANRFKIAMITMDNWQTADTKRIFESKGLYTEFMTIKKDHYDTLSTCIYDERLEGYYHPILVDQELLKLQLIKGTKVDHPQTGFKDGSDCMAGAVWTCTTNTVYEDDIEIEVLGWNRKKQVIIKEDAPKKLPKPDIPDDLQDFISNLRVL